MPVKLTIDNSNTDHFSITLAFDVDALEKVGPCRAPDVQDVEGDELIAFMFKKWCDHKASAWAHVLENASLRVEQAEKADDLDGDVVGPNPQPTNEEV